jgi:hypothetical protein
MAQPQNFVYVARFSGLANRLRAIVGYKALCNLLGAKFYLCWSRHPSCNIEYQGILDDLDTYLISEADLGLLQRSSENLIITKSTWFDDIWLKFGRNHISYPDYLDEIKRELHNIRFTTSIIREADIFKSQINLSDMIGFHIRYTDNILEYQQWARKSVGNFDINKISALEGFENIIAQSRQDIKFYLATDNQGILMKFIEKYYNRIYYFAKDYIFANDPLECISKTIHDEIIITKTSKKRTTSIPSAAIEMLLLGNCKAIVGTYYSSFGKFSAIRSDTPYSEVNGKTCVHDPLISITGDLRCSIFQDL